MLKRVLLHFAIILTLITSVSRIGVIGAPPPVNELEEIKKLIPPNVILYRVAPQDSPTLDIDPIQTFLAKYKIGNTLSKTLQNDYYTVMRKTLGTDIYEKPNLFMTQCAREIKGYYLSVQILAAEYSVVVEYSLFDPNKNTMLCSNLLKKDFKWSLKRFSKTDMIDSSLDESVKDMVNQLQIKGPELIGM